MHDHDAGCSRAGVEGTLLPHEIQERLNVVLEVKEFAPGRCFHREKNVIFCEVQKLARLEARRAVLFEAVHDVDGHLSCEGDAARPPFDLNERTLVEEPIVLFFFILFHIRQDPPGAVSENATEQPAALGGDRVVVLLHGNCRIVRCMFVVSFIMREERDFACAQRESGGWPSKHRMVHSRRYIS